jgi:hypothetical protein
MVPETDTPPQKPFGGPSAHKNPNCRCNACVARRRKEEALALADRAGRGALAPKPSKKTINADNPYVTQGRSPKDRVGQWVLMRQQEPGITNVEIAKRLGITVVHLNSVIGDAVKAGWLKFDDPFSRLEHEIIPKVMDNLSLFLDQKDKTVTLETAKGTVFKTYAEAKGVTEAPQNVIAIRIEAADPAAMRVITGQIVGEGRKIDADPKD